MLFALCALIPVGCSQDAVDKPLAEEGPPCKSILSEAIAKAPSNSRRVIGVFGASWCHDCSSFESFLQRKDVGGILKKYYAVTFLRIYEKRKYGSVHGDTPGAIQWLKAQHIEPKLPTVVIVDENSKIVLSSDHASKKVDLPPLSGFLTTDTEMEVFLRMIDEGAPNVSMSDLKSLRRIIEKNLEEQVSKAVSNEQGMQEVRS